MNQSGEARLADARKALRELCNGERFTMRVPADPINDHDLRISAALDDLQAALAQPVGVDRFDEGVEAVCDYLESHCRATLVHFLGLRDLKRETPRPAAPTSLATVELHCGRFCLKVAGMFLAVEGYKNLDEHFPVTWDKTGLEHAAHVINSGKVEPPQGDGLRELLIAAEQFSIWCDDPWIEDGAKNAGATCWSVFKRRRERLDAAIEKAKSEVARKETP